MNARLWSNLIVTLVTIQFVLLFAELMGWLRGAWARWSSRVIVLLVAALWIENEVRRVQQEGGFAYFATPSGRGELVWYAFLATILIAFVWYARRRQAAAASFSPEFWREMLFLVVCSAASMAFWLLLAFGVPRLFRAYWG